MAPRTAASFLVLMACLASARPGWADDPAPEWPGSFAVEAIDTRFKLSGFAQLDVIYDDGAITTPCDFETVAIVTRDPSDADGASGRTSFCVNSSRLRFESRTPFGRVRLGSYASFDFYGGGSEVPVPRLRQLYGELTDLVPGGDLLIGQAWTTFGDVSAWPDILDFEGPSNAIGVRQPLVRWTQAISGGVSLEVAAETPFFHSILGADPATDVTSLARIPDGVMALRWDHPLGHLWVSGLARDLRGSSEGGPTLSAVGWGVTGSGKLTIPLLAEQDNLTFQVSYGKGIGSYNNDRASDAIYDPAASSLLLIPRFGVYVGLEHFWIDQLSTTAVFGYSNVEVRDLEPPEALDNSYYFSVNLNWRPHRLLQFGAEYLRGERQDKDGQSGLVNRVQVTGIVSF